MKRLKRALALLLALAAALSCMTLLGCKKDDDGQALDSDNVGRKIICKAADFESHKGTWYGTGSLVSNGAEATHTDDLVVGELYYFVYTFKLDYKGDGWDSTELSYDLTFGVKTWDGLHYGADAVRFEPDKLVTDGEIDATLSDGGEVSISKALESGDVRAYIAVPFVPQRTGMLFIESIVTGYVTAYKPLDDKVPRVFANVLASGTNVEGAAAAAVSNLSYGLVGQEVYEGGQLENAKDLAAISKMSPGRNYVVVDFDVVAESAAAGEVYCGIYMHAGEWSDVTLEQANTAKFNQTELDGGRIFDFAYSVPQDGSKSIRTVLSFTALDVCAIDFEFFVYSDNTRVSGSRYDCDHFADESVSTLKLRVEPSEHRCYVEGYETMTGNVVIPSFHKGYPVTVITDNAFAGCTSLKLINMNAIREIGFDAFSGCTSLEVVGLGTKLELFKAGVFKNCTALKQIFLPESLRAIAAGTFAGCTSLESVEFANPYSWQVSGKDPYVTYFTYPQLAADALTGGYAEKGLTFLPTVNIENLSLGLVDESTYRSGNYDDKITENWSQMRYGNKYYWILDMDLSTYSTATNYNWRIQLTRTLNYTIKLKEMIGADYSYYEASTSTDTGLYLLYVGYGEVTNEPVPLRLVFEVTPVSGSRIMELSIGGEGDGIGYVTGDGGMFKKLDLSIW